jgi:hypothetical protein
MARRPRRYTSSSARIAGIVEVGPRSRSSGRRYVDATVRRGHSLYDQIGTYDMTTDDVATARHHLRHGFLTGYCVDAPEYIIQVLQG